jgi:hypothetical protein
VLAGRAKTVPLALSVDLSGGLLHIVVYRSLSTAQELKRKD